MKFSACFSLGVLVALASSPVQAKVIATCHGSVGKAFYGDTEQQWVDDKISAGLFLFTMAEDGTPNLLFRDAYGKTIDATADGAKINYSYLHSENLGIGFIVVYEEAGVVETYNIITEPDGKRRVYWTANKSGARGLTKVSAMVADCD